MTQKPHISEFNPDKIMGGSVPSRLMEPPVKRKAAVTELEESRLHIKYLQQWVKRYLQNSDTLRETIADLRGDLVSVRKSHQTVSESRDAAQRELAKATDLGDDAIAERDALAEIASTLTGMSKEMLLEAAGRKIKAQRASIVSAPMIRATVHPEYTAFNSGNDGAMGFEYTPSTGEWKKIWHHRQDSIIRDTHRSPISPSEQARRNTDDLK